MTISNATLSEASLEAMLAELSSTTGKPISVRPTKLLLRMDVVAELAQERGVSVDEMMETIRQLVADRSGRQDD